MAPQPSQGLGAQQQPSATSLPVVGLLFLPVDLVMGIGRSRCNRASVQFRCLQGPPEPVPGFGQMNQQLGDSNVLTSETQMDVSIARIIFRYFPSCVCSKAKSMDVISPWYIDGTTVTCCIYANCHSRPHLLDLITKSEPPLWKY